MADLIKITDENGNTIIDSNGAIDYGCIINIPSSVVDTSTHNHDDLYASKLYIEDRFNRIMNTVSEITKSLTVRPLKTKGFLNGGYKSGNIWARKVQRFNTVTETGSEINSGALVTSYYTPGASSELHGYYFGTNTGSSASADNPRTGRDVDKITYLTEVEEYLGTITHHNSRASLYDIYSQTKVFVTDGSQSWSKITASTDVCEIVSTSTTAQSSTRQGLSSELFGYVVNAGQADRTSTKFIYLTTLVETGTTQNIRQLATGLSKDKDKGYWIDYGTANNWRVDMLNNSVSNIVCFTEGFGESNSFGSEKVGFMMGGYDGAQHGKVQKMVWSTETASNVLGGSLAIPQSSAGMAEA